jgi:signal peptidase I
MTKPANPTPKPASSLRSTFVALLIALVFRTTAVQAFNIPSGSATPTLLTGDYVAVSKFAYGFSRYSLPFIAPQFLHGRLFGAAPKLGDTVVFANPKDDVVTLKRIVGLPGDHIQLVHGILTINGIPCKRERAGTYVERDWDDSADQIVETERYRYTETLPNGVKHAILGMPVDMPEDSGPVDDTQIYVVPPNHYFGMGDSRDNSADSRFLSELGYIPAENLIGRADLRLISLEPGAAFWQIWKWPAAMRFSRFFHTIS